MNIYIKYNPYLPSRKVFDKDVVKDSKKSKVKLQI